MPVRPVCKVLLCGDVMLGRGVDQIMPGPLDPRLYESYATSAMDYVRLAEAANGPIPRPVPPAYVWGDALAAWDALRPDARIVNLETAVTRSDRPLPKGINYRMSPDHVGALAAAKVDLCVLANNHVLDWGEAGLVETLAALQHHGLRTAGAGRSLAEAEAPAVLDLGPKGRLLVIACATGDSGVPAGWAAGPRSAGVNRIDLTDAAVQRIARLFAAVRRPNDIAIVSIHWGANWGYAIPEASRRFARALIDHAGVSIVYGHSSHHAQAAEVMDGRLALYGCGDLVNDYEGISGHEDYRGDLVAAYLAAVDPSNGALTEFDILPFHVRRFRLETPDAKDLGWLRARLGHEYSRFGMRIERATATRWRVRWGLPPA